jgi:hypothetical protein
MLEDPLFACDPLAVILFLPKGIGKEVADRGRPYRDGGDFQHDLGHDRARLVNAKRIVD